MAGYAGTTITTELIQKYLDENKQLILAILDNQNLGKLNECATYQAKLQQNLMYLAAIADAQPQAPTTQMVSGAMMQPGQSYLGQQQQYMAVARNSVPFNMSQSPVPSHQTQQTTYGQPSLSGGRGATGMHLMTNDSGMGGMGGNGPTSSGGFSEYGHNMNTETVSGPNGGFQGTGMGLGNTDLPGAGGAQLDMSVSSSNIGQSAAHTGDGRNGPPGTGSEDLEPSYLKASDEDGS